MPTAKAVVTDITGPAIFMAWLDAQIEADGRSAQTIADAAGVSYNALYRARRYPDKPLGEQSVRTLASFFGGDPDEWSARTGYTDVNATTPDPDDFDTVPDWLRATLALRRESSNHASLAMGLSVEALRQVLAGHVVVPNRPTLVKMAGYFRVHAAKLLAMRSKHPNRVEAGRRTFHRQSAETQERVKENLTHQTTEDHRRIGRVGGAVSSAKIKRTRSPTYLSDLLAHARVRRREVNAERGSRFRSEETRQQYIERWRASGAAEKARATSIERYGLDYFVDKLRAANQPGGELVLCKACEDKEQKLYQTDGVQRHYHLECYLARLQTSDAVERLQGFQAVAWILERVAAFGDTQMKQDIQQRAATQRDDLRRAALGLPKPPRRPSTLARDKNLAVNAAILFDEFGLPAREIGEMMGFKVSIDQRGHESQVRQAWNLIRFGRALRGTGQ